jgi:hypothetical protein
MKKHFFLFAMMICMVLPMLATIHTVPANGITSVGDNVEFSLDCGTQVFCSWDWGDGTSVSQQWEYLVQTHYYKNPGSYSVHVHREVSPYGNVICPIDEYTTISVLEDRTISASPLHPLIDQVVTFTASNFNRPDNITWDLGDGTFLKGQGPIVSHAFARGGTYTIRAYDWNGDTTKIPVSLSLTVASLNRAIAYSPASPRADQEVAIQAINFKSSSITWDFGDGTPQQTYSAAVAHRYPNSGTFTISAKENGLDLPPVTKSIAILPDNRSLVLSASEARKGEPLTFTALNFRGPLVLWDFGDGSTASGPGSVARSGRLAGISGPITMTHAYPLPGTYVVTARDENGASAKNFTATVRILGITDEVNLEIAEITLDNGKYYKVVPKNSKNIRAQLRMKMRGTGIVSGFWILDGQPFSFFNEIVYQGQIKTIVTPAVPGLPVFDPGMHTITLQLTRPEGGIVFPTLRYFVLPYENVIATLAPRDGAIIKEDEVAGFSWESALGGSYYQIAFSNSLFPLLRNDPSLKWLDCPERFSYTPDLEAWNAIARNQTTFWKVRATDSGKNIVAESGVQEMKVIVPGAKIGIQKITDMDGKTIPIGGALTMTRAEQVLIHGSLTYPAEAEFLVVRIYAGEELVDQLLFRDVRKDEARFFETSVPNTGKECLVAFHVLKSSSPSVLVGYEELKLKKE